MKFGEKSIWVTLGTRHFRSESFVWLWCRRFAIKLRGCRSSSFAGDRSSFGGDTSSYSSPRKQCFLSYHACIKNFFDDFDFLFNFF